MPTCLTGSNKRYHTPHAGHQHEPADRLSSPMKILFIGDTVGKAGRTVVHQHLKPLQEDFAVDLTILNCENAAAGFGVTPKIPDELFDWGIDVLTSGNHIWDKKEIMGYLG